MSHQPATPNEGKCPVCGVPGRIVGHTTKHFESDFEALLAIERAKAFEEAALIVDKRETHGVTAHILLRKAIEAREGK
jgi:hypothetical protein